MFFGPWNRYTLNHTPDSAEDVKHLASQYIKNIVISMMPLRYLIIGNSSILNSFLVT